MLVVMQEGADESQIQKVIDRLVSMGFIVHRSSGILHTVLGGVGPVGDVDPIEFEVMEGVKECHRIVSPYKLASRHFKPGGTVVKIGDVEIGGDRGGRDGRAVQRRESRPDRADRRSWSPASGAKVLRGGAFKPRTSPYSFQGLGEEGLRMMREAADRHGLLLVSEVMDQTQIPLLADYVRHPASGRPQHAELQPAARAGATAQADPAEARHFGHHRRAAAQRRIHPFRRQLRRDPVRARHPHLSKTPRATPWTFPPFRW